MAVYDDAGLVCFTQALFEAAGMDPAIAAVTADRLAEGDRLGHDTHGLALVPRYVEALQSGSMTAKGAPVVLADNGGAIVWDGGYLPGPWLIDTAMKLASSRARLLGVAAVAIRRSHHTACLQAYLEQVTRLGQVALLFVSDPADASVVPFGGIDPVLSTDPLAVGIPTCGDPLLIDMSTTIATNAVVARAAAAGKPLAGEWLQDADGNPTSDPSVLSAWPKGALLPVGGLDHGHKGTSLALLVEALTQGLAGRGRRDAETRWGASVFLQVIDPGIFSGAAVFAEQAGNVADRCRASRPRQADAPVRLPGDRALAHRKARVGRVELAEPVASAMATLSERYGVAFPSPLSSGAQGSKDDSPAGHQPTAPMQ